MFKHQIKYVLAAILCIAVPGITLATGVINDFGDSANWNLRIDGAAAGDMLGFTAFRPTIVDLDSNGEQDMLLGSWLSDNSGRSSSGSLWVIFDTLLQDHVSDTSDTITLSSTSTWNIRFDGAAANDWLSVGGFVVDDLNNNGESDLVITSVSADFTNPTNSGSVYIIYDELLDSFSGTGNVVDMASTTSFNIRIDGALANQSLGFLGSLDVADMDNDGLNDLLVGSRLADYTATDAGSLYLIDDSILDDYTGTGNIVNLATTTNFTARFDGEPTAKAHFSHGLPDQVDLNGNGLTDLIVGAYGRNNTFVDSGSFYVIYDSILDNISGTGNIFPLATSTNYNIRLDGYDKHALFAAQMKFGDVDGNGEPDILVSASDAPDLTDEGYSYLFYNQNFDDYIGTGNTAEVNASSTYSVSFRGSQSMHNLGQGLDITDFNLDGLNDIVLYAQNAEDEATDAGKGATYVLYNDIFGDLTGTGNIHTVASTSDYSIRYDGAEPGHFLGDYPTFRDVNEDGRPDIILHANVADYGGTDSGSLYITLNFPHSITASGNTTINADTNDIVTLFGDVSAPLSMLSVDAVGYNTNGGSPIGSWSDCVATDGAFDETEESFECLISGLSVGTHEVYVRAEDANSSLTEQEDYVLYTLNISEVVEESSNGSQTSSGGSAGSHTTNTPELDPVGPSDPEQILNSLYKKLILLLEEMIRQLVLELDQRTDS